MCVLLVVVLKLITGLSKQLQFLKFLQAVQFHISFSSNIFNVADHYLFY